MASNSGQASFRRFSRNNKPDCLTTGLFVLVQSFRYERESAVIMAAASTQGGEFICCCHCYTGTCVGMFRDEDTLLTKVIFMSCNW